MNKRSEGQYRYSGTLDRNLEILRRFEAGVSMGDIAKDYINSETGRHLVHQRISAIIKQMTREEKPNNKTLVWNKLLDFFESIKHLIKES